MLFFLVLLFPFLIFASEPDGNCKFRLPETINSYQPSIQPVFRIDGKVLYFDRKLHPENIAGTKDVDDIWYSVLEENKTFSKAYNLGNEFNSHGSDVLFSISPSGQALIFGTKNGNEKGFSTADIDSFGFKNYQPILIKNFYNNSDNYFAYLNHNSNVLLLSLNRKDSKGELDIYVCFREDGSNNFSEPINIGTSINTAGTEGSPFLAYDDNSLYFSSNGQKGFGGKDLYVSRRLDDSWTNWSKPVNLGSEINTSKDENSIYLTALGDSAIINSWDSESLREGLYTVCLSDSLQPMPYAIVTGRISARDLILTNFDNIEIIVKYDNDSRTDIYRPNYGNNFYFILPAETFSPIVIKKDGFEQFGFSVSSRNLAFSKYIHYNALLSKPRSNRISLGKVMFDYDSYVLSREWLEYLAKIDDKVIYPSNAKLEIIGHTDEKGPMDYNLKLSEKRAEQVKSELLKYGFSASNMTVIAKGKAEPDSDKQERNRRVEIYLIED